MTWHERVVGMQATAYARAQEVSLRQRLTTARTALTTLTARKGKGQRRDTPADARPASAFSKNTKWVDS